MARHEKSPELKEKVSILPDTPGVYMYFDAAGTVIYVGKAKNLKRRVSSYFNRTNLLVRNIADMKYIVVPTEQDALNLENAMIKEYKPRYNVLLKDDKSYPWIVVTNEMYPRVFLTRQHIRDGSKYYGPYTNTSVARTVLDLIGELYPVRTCRIPITPEYISKGRGRHCLQYHIRKCRGCCTGEIDENTYSIYIDRIRQILIGETQELMTYLRGEMERLASELRFEEAAALRDRIAAIKVLGKRQKVIAGVCADTDVWGLYLEAKCCFAVLHYEEGQLTGKEAELFAASALEEEGEILSALLLQYYGSRSALPREIFIPAAIEDQEVLEQLLTEKAGHRVTLRVPQRGERAQVLQMAETNAREEAERAKTAASVAKTSAQDAAKSAAGAADSANEARQYSGKPPIIQNGTWWTWDAAKQEYADTGEAARGNVMYATFWVDARTGLLHMYTDDEYTGPQFRLNGKNLEVVLTHGD